MKQWTPPQVREIDPSSLPVWLVKSMTSEAVGINRRTRRDSEPELRELMEGYLALAMVSESWTVRLAYWLGRLWELVKTMSLVILTLGIVISLVLMYVGWGEADPIKLGGGLILLVLSTSIIILMRGTDGR